MAKLIALVIVILVAVGYIVVHFAQYVSAMNCVSFC